MNLLVTGASFCSENELNTLRSLGNNIVFMQHEKHPLPCEPAWVEGVVGNGIFLYHPIENFTSLQYIQLTSAGFDRVPMNYIQNHNIEIHNARGVYSVPIAEFVLCSILQLYKEFRFFNDNQRKHIWEKNRNLIELHEKNVCVVGCGSIGTECAKRFSAFGAHVLGVDITPYDSSSYERMLPISQLNKVLGESDIVVLTVPLDEKTHHLMNEKSFLKMKKGSILVNVSRGGLIDTKALIQTLENEHIAGAILDVFEEEPLPNDSPLWDMKNVIITPHNSFVGSGNHARLWNVIKNNLMSKRNAFSKPSAR